MKRWRMLFTPLTTFLVVVLVSVLASTWLLRLAQSEAMRRVRAETPQSAEISSTQERFLASRGAGSELLFKLAFASLGALLGLRFSDKAQLRIGSHAHFAAAGLLLGSIYNAFLYQESVAHVLEGPLEMLYGAELRYPVVCQFWFLFAAVTLLAVSLFRPSRKIAGALLFALAVGLTPAAGQRPAVTEPQPSAAATPSVAAGRDPAVDLAQCGAEWMRSRGVAVSGSSAGDLGELAARLARRSEVNLTALTPVDRCAFVSALADGLRYAAINEGATADAAGQGRAVAGLLDRALSSTADPTFSPGELVHKLLAAAQIWREPAAVLDIDAGDRTLFISVNDPRERQLMWRGYTRLLLRIPPGTYQLSASEDGVIVSRRTLTVGDGDRIPISLGGPR